MAGCAALQLKYAAVYVNESVYGSFNDVITESRPHPPSPLTLGGTFQSVPLSAHQRRCTVFGQTCDSLDLICPEAVLPVSEVHTGDWLRFSRMGAYTGCTATRFNGFPETRVEYTIDACERDEARIRRLLGVSSDSRH